MEERQKTFRSLPAARRRAVLEAALQEFAAHDYKEANTEAVALRAGVSKGTLFNWFQNKQALYLATLHYIVGVVEQAMRVTPPPPGADLFDLLGEYAAKKLPVCRAMPTAVRFAVRAYYNAGGEVGRLTQHWMTKQMDGMYQKYFAQVDTSRFRPGYGPRQAVDLLFYLADGYLHAQLMAGRPLDMDDLFARYAQWQEMVRRFVYREDAL